MYPGLELPELPADTPEAQWKFYPLNVAPPVPGHLAEAAGLHKTVPRWSEGWELEWHGTSLYGISSCLAIGEVMPSEADNVHNGTACGRGAYTTQSHAVACKYAINHYFGIQVPGQQIQEEEGKHTRSTNGTSQKGWSLKSGTQ